MNWKYDAAKEIFYVPVGSFLCLCKNSKTVETPCSEGYSHKKQIPIGVTYLSFLNERTFGDGTVVLSETMSVAGGISRLEALQLQLDLTKALHLLTEDQK